MERSRCGCARCGVNRNVAVDGRCLRFESCPTQLSGELSSQSSLRGTKPTAAFLKAMHDVRLSHGRIGPVRLDEYGTPVLDIYIRKVARENGKLVNTILKTYPQVSQFWTYDPAQFVRQPTFSRDYPSSKNLG